MFEISFTDFPWRIGDAGAGRRRSRQRDPAFRPSRLEDDEIDDRWTKTSLNLVHQFG